ncbi:MAG: hypothetical protein Q9184_005210 [Pyrenodesmia sp. 2 TL-2023]
MICHAKPYKYCCPRCSSRTCSLPCQKRHKQWASCNGLRDPAAYIKRSDLATAKGIDHDYNYLTSIERQIDTAERDCEARGILLFEESAKSKRSQPVKGAVALENAIKQCRVVVDRAPKGMSRQKQNATYWDKRGSSHAIIRAKRIVWTVEWVHKNGHREIGKFPESETMENAYIKLTTTRIKKEVGEAEPPRKKHKPNDEAPRPPTLHTKSACEEVPTESSVSPASHAPPTQISETIDPAAEPTNRKDQTTPSLDPSNDQLPPPSTAPTQASPPPLNFYLLLPSTPTSYRVLIPVLPSDTLSTALTDRLVLEFPTIYALKQPPDKLPTGFMTEEGYLNGLAEKGHVNRHLDGLLSGAGNWETGRTERNGERDLDEGALRDVLKRDLVQEVDVA